MVQSKSICKFEEKVKLLGLRKHLQLSPDFGLIPQDDSLMEVSDQRPRPFGTKTSTGIKSEKSVIPMRRLPDDVHYTPDELTAMLNNYGDLPCDKKPVHRGRPTRRRMVYKRNVTKWRGSRLTSKKATPS